MGNTGLWGVLVLTESAVRLSIYLVPVEERAGDSRLRVDIRDREVGRR
jgi:hypothetical protein